MKRALIFITCLFYSLASAQQPPVSLNWVKHFGGPRYDVGNALKADEEGNIYVAGGFQDDADFNPGMGEAILSGQATQDLELDVFAAKYDPQGNLIWLNGITGTKPKDVRDLEMDQEGNIFIAGSFKGTVQFGNGQEYTFSSTNGKFQTYVAKMNNNGEFLWVKAFGGSEHQFGLVALEIDQQGSCIVTGMFNDTVDFDPGVGVFERAATSHYSNSFILKLDENGNFVWAKALLDKELSHGICLDVDATGNIYTSGSFYDTIDLDPGINTVYATSLGDYDSYLVKLDPDGNFIWEKHYGGSDVDQAIDIAVAPSGNIYLLGNFENNATDFDPGNEVVTLPFNGGTDMYILKLDASGNFVWAKGIGGTDNDYSGSLYLTKDEDLFVTGSFRMDVDFDPGPGTYTMSSMGYGSGTAFMLRMNPDGNFVWAAQIYGNQNGISSIDFAPDGGIYAIGGFNGQTDFDPGEFGYYQAAQSEYADVFILKWSEHPSVNNPAFTSVEDVLVYPNPFSTQLYIEFINDSDNASVLLYNSLGELVLRQLGIMGNKAALHTDQLAFGLYTAVVQDGDAVKRVKLVK